METRPQSGDRFTHDFFFTQEQVLAFADLSGDKNPIHVSPELASQSQFRQCIVHGYFTISVFSKIFGMLLYADGNILLEQSARYLKPVFTDVPYRAVVTVKTLFPEKSRVLYTTELIEPVSGEVLVKGEALLMNKKYYVW